MISRTERAFSPSLFSLNPSTSGGGAAGGVPMMFSRIQAPRSTGAVRLAYEVASSTLPFPSSPQRLASASVTRRNWSPRTFGIP
jgi:hypothetical protein